MTDLDLARGIAAKFHAEQQYGTRPYTDHLDMVEASIAQVHSDERFLIVAQLHDIVEDTPCKLEFIGGLFGSQISAAVFAITKGASEERGDYLKRVKANDIALIVKLHDTFCNLRQSLLDFDMKRVKRYASQLEILAS